MQKPIGVIDSGVGGLTVLNELTKRLPKEKFIYFGDSLRAPYGSKEKEEVIGYVFEIVQFLMTKDIKVLVIACNTATAYALEILKESLSIPVIGVIKPGARAALKVTKNKNIGVIGTLGLIDSNAYFETLCEMDSTVNVHQLGCPMFVPIIEKGKTEGKELDLIVESTLNPLKKLNIDTLILGCTHYPIIEGSIKKVFSDEVTIVSSAEETANETNLILNSLGICEKRDSDTSIIHDIYTSGDLKKFIELTNKIFSNNLSVLGKLNFIEKRMTKI